MTKPRKTKRNPLGYRVLVACTVCVFAFVAVETAIVIRERAEWALDPDNALFEQQCGRCHTTAMPRAYAKGPHQWRNTVDRMLDEKGVPPPTPIPESIRRRLVAILVRHRSADGEELFKYRCGACHSRRAVEPYLALEPEALEELVRQHASRANFVVQAWEADLIVEQILARRRQNPPPPGRTGPAVQLRYQRVCGTCHTPTFLYRTACEPSRSDAEWKRVVERMRRKEPGNFVEGDVEALTAHAARICRSNKIAP